VADRAVEEIELCARRLSEELPALKKLKLSLCLELRGRGDVQHFTVALPELAVKRTYSSDAHLTVSLRREEFNELSGKGLRDWHDAYNRGRVAVSGQEPLLKLLGEVIRRREARRRAQGP